MYDSTSQHQVKEDTMETSQRQQAEWSETRIKQEMFVLISITQYFCQPVMTITDETIIDKCCLLVSDIH